jgi:glycosyltransferase involved in cell wall biosynthesis
MPDTLKQPFVSVVIVSYNCAQDLPRALNACKSQTFEDFEIVIVNNGSTDNSEEIIDEFITKNSQLRVKLIYIEKNEGLPKGRNAGMDAATGEYILFNDADDWMDNNCLELLAKKAEQTRADRIIGAFKDVNIDDKIIHNRMLPQNPSKWRYTMFQANLYRRTVFIENNLRFPDHIYYDDYYVNLYFNYYCKKCAFVNVPTYSYFVTATSTTGFKVMLSTEKIVNWFSDLCKDTSTIINLLSGQDREEVLYQNIKTYYAYLLHHHRYCEYKVLIQNYKALNEVMLQYYPQYLKCKNITLFKANNDTFYGRSIIWFISTAEKTHLIKSVLFTYSRLSKIFFFKV